MNSNIGCMEESFCVACEWTEFGLTLLSVTLELPNMDGQGPEACKASSSWHKASVIGSLVCRASGHR